MLPPAKRHQALLERQFYGKSKATSALEGPEGLISTRGTMCVAANRSVWNLIPCG